MPPQRNLLVLIGSGLRHDAFGGSGAWPIVTPHLDGVQRHGLALTAVAASVGGGPALVSLMTGLQVRQHGISDHTRHIPILQGWVHRLREAGYHIAGVGRVASVAQHLHQVCVVSDQPYDPPSGCEYWRFATRQQIAPVIARQRDLRQRSGPFEMSEGLAEPSQDIDAFITSRAEAMIERMPHDQPWAMIVVFSGPGNDLPAPVPYQQVVEPDALKRPFAPATFDGIDDVAELLYPRILLQNQTPDSVAHIRAHYLGRVSLIDAGVGVLRDAIDRHGHAPRTWLVVGSDKGYMLGEQGLIGCRTAYSGDLLTPLWILPPQGADSSYAMNPDACGLISTIDLGATLCAIGGADPPRDSEGESVLGLLVGETVGRDAVISEFARRMILQTRQYRVCFDIESGEARALFDIRREIGEKRNLIDTVTAANVLDRLRWQLGDSLLPLRCSPVWE